MNLRMEIGYAVKQLDSALLEREPTIAWNQIARMRDVLVHHYHDTDFDVVEAVVNERVAPLREAVLRLRQLDTGA